MTARWKDNPFFVLGLLPECSRADVERAGQKLLGLLELGIASAKTYATPLGAAERTADKVRSAMAELRDPDARLSHEIWARTQLRPSISTNARMDSSPAENPAENATKAWDGAFAALGWRAP